MASVEANPAADGPTVTLIGEGGESFIIPLEAAKASVLIRDTVSGDDGAEDGTGDDLMTLEPINMPRVRGACLQKIVEFLIHHSTDPMKEIPHPLPADTFEQNVENQWYENFFSDENMPRDMLFDVLRAANYMDIKPLLDLACLKITFMLNGKTEEEIRQLLNLPAMTPEEEKRAREQHPWIFENS